jgi:hypothetical protein
MCTNTSFPPSLGWIKPKPFWPLNHFTVPVGILFSKEHPRDHHAIQNSTGRCLWEGARGRIQKGTAANRMPAIYALWRRISSIQKIRRRWPGRACLPNNRRERQTTAIHLRAKPLGLPHCRLADQSVTTACSDIRRDLLPNILIKLADGIVRQALNITHVNAFETGYSVS